MAALSETQRTLERRLSQLQHEATRFGYSTPPHVSMEIEDIQRKLEILKAAEWSVGMIDTHRRHLKVLLNQARTFGPGHTPAYVVTEIANDRSEIAKYREICRTKYGLVVETEPEDLADPEPEPIPVRPLPEKLRRALTNLRKSVADSRQFDAFADVAELERLLKDAGLLD